MFVLFFLEPHSNASIGPLPQFVSAKNPAKYEEMKYLQCNNSLIRGNCQGSSQVHTVEEVKVYNPCEYCVSHVSVIWRDGQQKEFEVNKGPLIVKTFVHAAKTWNEVLANRFVEKCKRYIQR